MDERIDDRFLRLILDAAPSPVRSGSYGGGFRLRALTDHYSRYATETRYQAEGRIDLARRVGRASDLWTSGSLEGRTYPDSTRRDYHRGTWIVGIRSPLRRGKIGISGRLGGIDYRRTARFDRHSQAFTAQYERPLTRHVDLIFLAEFEWSQYGRPAFKEVAPDLFETRGDQRDRGREARLGLRYLRGWLYETTVSWESIRSNSFGYSVTRRALEGGVSGWLPGAVLLQVRGRIEAVSYQDRDLGRLFSVLADENLEAQEDNNHILVRLQRRLGTHLGVEGRVSLFRNESLLIGEFYRKGVASLGLVWTPLGTSDF